MPKLQKSESEDDKEVVPIVETQPIDAVKEAPLRNKHTGRFL